MKVLALANLYRASHVKVIGPYRPLNPVASSWNTALFDALAQLDESLQLHVVQFWPVLNAHTIQEGRLTYHYLPRVPVIDGFTSALKRWRLKKLLAKLQPDVVHGIGSEHGYTWPVVGRGIPSAITIHGYMRVINELPGHGSRLKRLFLAPEEERSLRRADRVVAINGYMRDRFVNEAGCDPARTTVIANAINPVFLQEVLPCARDIDLLLVGTLHPLKNQDVALQILKRLAERHGRRPKVTIVGSATSESADYAARLQAMVQDPNLAQVSFAGQRSAAELAELYRRSRFLLHLSQFEADPTVTAEALLCGTLPVVNPVAGLKHRVRDGWNGWHLNVENLEEAVDRLYELLDQETHRATMVVQGRAEVVQERHPSAVARATVAMYREMLLKESPSPGMNLAGSGN